MQNKSSTLASQDADERTLTQSGIQSTYIATYAYMYDSKLFTQFTYVQGR